jgi:signal transduction histidine kinase/ActR/RegA family two-component response regulator
MSIRARLVLLLLSITLPALLAALSLVIGGWALARDNGAAPPGWWQALVDERVGAWTLAGAAALLILLAVAATLWVSRRIVAPLESLLAAARKLQRGEPVQPAATGVVECDKVLASLADASHALRDAHDDLELQVEQAVLRTREAEQRVSRSQRIEALGRLTGGVAHDFNNLLGVVSNSAYLIQRQTAPGEHAAALAAILRSVETGHRMTQHLLRFAGRKPVRPQALDLRQHLLAMNELIATVLGSRIRLRAKVALDTRPVTVDAAELELTLINLALNARDAMPRGGEVLLHARNAAPDELDDLPEQQAAGASPGKASRGVADGWVLITFDDSGCGIDEEAARHAFEPFFTTKAVGKGTGLGLAQVRGFCVQAGGTARLASTPGLGTTVSLLLPASRVAEPAADPPSLAGPPVATGLSAALQGKRLLLVEDNEELSVVTAALLASFGAQVLRVPGADEALAAAAGQVFDVVLSDVVMPGSMDGLALARELRQRWPQLPVLLVSGYSSALSAAQASAGSDGDFEVLAKPFAPDALLAALQRTMEPAVALRA